MNSKKLNVLKVVDQWGWSYDFIGREQARYSRHNIIINKYDNVKLDGIDIIYIHSPNIHPSIADLPWEAKERGIKVIGAYGGDPKYYPDGGIPPYPYADIIATISPQTYKYGEDTYENIPTIFFPEGVDTIFFTPKPFDPTKFKAGWAGSFWSIKRCGILDKLIVKVHRQSDWGPKHFKYKRDLTPMLNFYHSIDTFVLSSETECMPRVVLESMACGLPVVSTAVGNVPFLINEKWLTAVHPEEKVIEQMNKCLKRLKYNKNCRKGVGERNRTFICRNFSWDVVQPYWDEIFDYLHEGRTKKIIIKNKEYLNRYAGHFK